MKRGRRLEPRERRVVLGGVIVAALVLGYVYAVEPMVRSREETRAQLHAAQLRMDRYEQLVARRDRLEQDKRAVEARGVTLRERLLTGPTPTLAAAQLQGAVKAEAQRLALAVQRIVVERPAFTGQVAEIPVHLTLKGEIRQISSFLKGIEQHRLAFSIPELTIQVQDSRNPKELIVDVVVAGYLVQSEAGASKRPVTTPNAKEGIVQ